MEEKGKGSLLFTDLFIDAYGVEVITMEFGDGGNNSSMRGLARLTFKREGGRLFCVPARHTLSSLFFAQIVARLVQKRVGTSIVHRTTPKRYPGLQWHERSTIRIFVRALDSPS
jgi:hypothetical protein